MFLRYILDTIQIGSKCRFNMIVKIKNFIVRSVQSSFCGNQDEAKLVADRQCHARAILTDDQAREIFRCKPTSNTNGRYKAALLARAYRVSAKTVRDIWVGRTWYWATYSLDSTKPIMTEKLQKKLGRPRGSKDSKPRNRKFLLDDMEPKSPATACKPEPMNQEIDISDRNYSAKHVALLTEPTLSKFQTCEHATMKETRSAICADAAWHERLLCVLPSSGFVDPFHDDWAFWATGNKFESDHCSPKPIVV